MGFFKVDFSVPNLDNFYISSILFPIRVNLIALTTLNFSRLDSIKFFPLVFLHLANCKAVSVILHLLSFCNWFVSLHHSERLKICQQKFLNSRALQNYIPLCHFLFIQISIGNHPSRLRGIFEGCTIFLCYLDKWRGQKNGLFSRLLAFTTKGSGDSPTPP